MRLRNVKNADKILNNCSFLIKNPQDFKGKFKDVFANSNPICLEIGIGKGQFIKQIAKKNPQINYIGIEKMSSIMARAIQNLSEEKLDNLKLIRCDALDLANIFAQEIDTIYLNFSDPWPKARHAKRRLTSAEFLKIYDKIFLCEKKIIQKTDNLNLLESSILSLNKHGYIIEDISFDLHKTDKENYQTEYEEKFSKLGVRINYLRAVKK